MNQNVVIPSGIIEDATPALVSQTGQQRQTLHYRSRRRGGPPEPENATRSHKLIDPPKRWFPDRHTSSMGYFHIDLARAVVYPRHPHSTGTLPSNPGHALVL